MLAAAAVGCADGVMPTDLATGSPSLNVTGSATCVVTSTADAGIGSLRALIADAACDVITFDLDGLGPHTITLTSGQLTIARDLTIIGPGEASLALSGNDVSRVFSLDEDPEDLNVEISGVTITRGSIVDAGSGGGIWNRATLTLTNVTVSESRAGFGGGIANEGTLTLMNSTVAGNTAIAFTTGVGGGILNTGTMTITNSTVSGNSSPPGGGGGGIYSIEGTATLTNSTVSGNSADGGGGGGIANNYGSLTLRNSTVTGNSAGGSGGIGNGFGTLMLTNSIVAGNVSDHSADVGLFEASAVTVTSSLIGSSEGNDLVNGTDGNIVGGNGADPIDPLLGPLVDNGGPTQTHALLTGSLAIDAGICAPAIATDQRGISRPQGPACDIGAFEVEVATPTFDFSGFLAPVVTAPAVNVMKASRAVPIKFSLAGDQGLAILDGVPTSRPIACDLAEGTSAIEETATAGTSMLTYDAVTDQYSYIWKTEKGWAGSCREFSLALSDGTTHTAQFQFTK